MSQSRLPGEGQESMIVAGGNEPLIAVQALPLDPETAVTRRDEQAAHLITVLTNFDVLPGQADWLLAARQSHTSLHQSLYADGSKKGDDYVKGRQKAFDKLQHETHDEFYKAFGRNVIIDAGLASAAQADSMAEIDYRQFESRYRGITPARVARRQSYKAYLKTIVEIPDATGQATETTTVEPLPLMAPVNLAARTALARMLRPEFQRLSSANYKDITQEIMDQYSPSRLKHDLINVTGRSPNAAGYLVEMPGKQPKMTYITVSPAAIKLTYNIHKLGESAANVTEKSRYREGGHIVDLDAVRRAGVHAVERRQKQIEKYSQNVIKPSIELIGKFEEALDNNAGLARFGNEASARIMFTRLQLGTFDEMLWAAAVNRGVLQEGQRLLMRRSVEKAIYFAPSAAERRRNFNSFLKLAKEWRLAQSDLFASLSATCAHYIETHQVND